VFFLLLKDRLSIGKTISLVAGLQFFVVCYASVEQAMEYLHFRCPFSPAMLVNRQIMKPTSNSTKSIPVPLFENSA
jgi:hypothetical protein